MVTLHGAWTGLGCFQSQLSGGIELVFVPVSPKSEQGTLPGVIDKDKQAIWSDGSSL